MSRRRLYVNSVAAVVQVIVSTALLFEFYRFLLRQLDTAHIGAWSLVLAVVSMAGIAEFGIGGSVVKFVAGDIGAGKRESAASTVAMCAGVVATAVALSFIVVAPVAYFILQRTVTDPKLFDEVRALLPWALAAVWTTSTSQVFLATLDACQRSYVRVGIGLLAAGAQLATAYYLVPRHGLQGVPPSLLVQAGLSLVLGLIAAYLTVSVPLRSWLRPDRARLGEVLRYGGGVQVIALAQLVFDPVVKLLLTTMSGLSLTGLYEVANKAVVQFRGLIVSAFQMLVPFLAHKIGGGDVARSSLVGIYKSIQGLLVVLAVPYYSLVAAALPTLLTLWIGRYDPTFVALGLICLAGWFVNTLVVAPYMIFMATGQLRWLIRSHLLIGIGSTALGAVFGLAFGGLGVVAGSMIGLAVGSLLIPVKFHAEYGIRAREFVPDGTGLLASVSIAGAAVLLAMQARGGAQLSPELAAAYGIFGIGCAIAVLVHPVTKRIIKRELDTQR